MVSSTPAAHYSRLSITLHWLMLVLLAAVYACIELRGLFPKGSAERDVMKDLHFMLGLSVFVLVWLRLALRLSRPTPAIVPKPPAWQTGLSHLVHLLLYLMMIGLPLAGWAILSAADKPIPFYGLELPAIVAPDPDLAKFIKGWHERIGSWGYWLIGLHALAGLYHHYVRRDNTLLRMLPYK
ncbi:MULTISPECIES: cytochrome b [Pseudomonas]|jgi:cytochrome b561|uniref:Cytochrome b n=2 Tax=Pseudomonas TaxID=286 RepID=A0ABV0DDT8_9PSED|nr:MULTISPECIES: cytochrome b [Pseudomonas]AZL67763.1 cytochrome b [Pseudomonas oryziphila]MDZ4017566.1 Cytochrome b561 [Pseudomonas sichuanensis]UVK84671.1 cytochrome b [Pseudomonas sichuanensis]UVL90871.1 cytochrome b [Pseudomonas sichuanensis]